MERHRLPIGKDECALRIEIVLGTGFLGKPIDRFIIRVIDHPVGIEDCVPTCLTCAFEDTLSISDDVVEAFPIVVLVSIEEDRD
jgi:hypothetical protein